MPNSDTDAAVETVLRKLILAPAGDNERVTESAIAELAQVHHAQAREILHELEKIGAIALIPRRGATRAHPANNKPHQFRSVWRALLTTAAERAAPLPPLDIQCFSAADPWERFCSLRNLIDMLGERSGNARLHRLLQYLAVRCSVAHSDRALFDLDALSDLVRSLGRGGGDYDRTALMRSFQAPDDEIDGRKSIEEVEGTLGPIEQRGDAADAVLAFSQAVYASFGRTAANAASNVTGQIAQRIREAIQFGDMRPGDQIREQPLAEQFGVSRAPVRDALRMLDRQGLVTLEPRRGAFVRTLDRAAIADLFEIRAAISGVQMAEAASSRDRGEKLNAQMRTGADLLLRLAEDAESPVGNYIVVRRGLATLTLKAGGNRVVSHVASMLEMEVSVLWAGVFDKERQKTSAAQWRLIVDAIIANDTQLAHEAGRRIVQDAATEAIKVAPCT